MSLLGLFIHTAKTLKRTWVRVRTQSKRFAEVGRNVRIGHGCQISPLNNVVIGSDVFIGQDCLFTTPNSQIRIGNGVMLAPQVALITGDHRIDVMGTPMHLTTDKTSETDQPITIEDDVWIGFRATILKGVHIGTGAVIAAGAVVTKDVPPNAVVAGVPARVVHYRFESPKRVD